ncbi:Dynein-like beta chain [Armadillidium vulgare iridescent virus]|uniref:Dynein-like beta chain n=1 Tax=Armadillidium vulgare iridescent virus TaxID=72201 RepID=A0A068QKV8_9VIRU|nr:Dynein-like beta chain [Armadillidium vulgare iridescent virus]CCV02483.1 Dynein-like beta chain [Armadillidium vulgare iridescent virus]
MIVNGKDFKIYSLDTNKTIVERLATMFRTIPKYLLFSDIVLNTQADEDNENTTTEGEPNFLKVESINVKNVIDDIKESIKKENLLSLSDFESRYENWFKQRETSNDSDSKLDLLKWYVLYFLLHYKTARDFKKKFGVSDPEQFLELQFLTEVGGREFDVDLPKKKKDTPAMLSVYKEEVQNNAARSEEEESQFERLEKIKDSALVFTPFVVEKIKISFTALLKQKTSLLSLLNTASIEKVLKVGETELRVAVIAAKNFFKINNKIEVYKLDSFYSQEDSGNNLTYSTDSLIITVMNTTVRTLEIKKLKEEKRRKPEFIDIVIKTYSQDVDKIMVEFDVNVKENAIMAGGTPSYDVDLKDTLQSFVMDILFSSPDEYNIISNDTSAKVKGSYYILNKYFQKELLLDAVMNDSVFSTLFVDERTKVTKQQTRLYMYFETRKTGLVSFSLLNQVAVTENDPLLRIIKGGGIKGRKGRVGTQYIKIRISFINDKGDIPFFQSQLNKLFSIFFSKEECLFRYYKRYIKKLVPGGQGIAKHQEEDDMDEDTEKDEKKDEKKDGREGSKKEKQRVKFKPVNQDTLAAKVPELFLPLYSRKCAKAPRIVSQNEAELIEKRNLQTMPYPIKKEGNLEASIYVCDHHKTHPYPGLRINALENSNVFKYLPCCYATNQRDRKGSAYGNYYLGQTPIDKTDHELYKTSRIVPNNIFGTLPTNIEKCLTINLLNNEGKEEYYRFGITHSPNSIIDCITRALGDYTFENDIEKRLVYLYSLRLQMLTRELIGVSRQETFDLDVQLVKKWIGDRESYFDPKHFLKILEDFFDVTIFLFERSVGNCTPTISKKDDKLKLKFEYIGESVQKYSSGGQLSIPNHSPIGTYLLRPIKDKVIFIYVHTGSDVDKVSYPQCETIVKFNNGFKANSKENIQVFRKHDAEVVNVQNIFASLTLQYEPIKDLALRQQNSSYIEDGKGLRIIDQFIDKSGKTRLLYATFDKSGESLKDLLDKPIAKSSELGGPSVLDVWRNRRRDSLGSPKFTIITEPIHPLKLPLRKITALNQNEDKLCIPLADNSEADITPLTAGLIKIVQETYNLKYFEASYTDYLCDASDYMVGYIGNVKIRIYVQGTRDESRASVRRKESKLSAYNHQKKVARVFFEYVLREFAKFIVNTTSSGIGMGDDLALETFLNTRTVVDTTHSYTIPNITVPFFADFDDTFKVAGKIIFTSRDLLRGVMYNVSLLTLRKGYAKSKFLNSLASKQIMSSYFENITDFKKDETYFIVYDSNVFLSFIFKSRQGELLQNTLEPFQGSKFFSTETVEDGKVFASRCFGNINDAIKYQNSVGNTNAGRKSGEIYIFDPQNSGFTKYDVDVPNIKIISFKVESGAYFITLNDMV